MLKINKKVEYALMALRFMSENKADGPTSARELCDRFQTPFDTTAKVMQAMNNAGILSSVQGTKGGYTLAKKLEDISYLEISEIVEGKKEASICHSKGKPCDLLSNCNIHAPVASLNIKINSYLGTLTLKELFSGNELGL